MAIHLFAWFGGQHQVMMGPHNRGNQDDIFYWYQRQDIDHGLHVRLTVDHA